MSTLADRPAAGPADPGDRPLEPPRIVVRIRLIAVCLALGVLAFMQEPGRLVADTKFDLLVDPVGLMTRALHAWEPLGFAGQAQNQGYGYLFPMGPFFALGEALALPEWVVQRLWWTLLLCAAFVGLERLAAALGIGTPWTRLIAGLAYALAPRVMTTLGPISAEALPLALAPWVVLPLVRGARGGSALRAAALSGIAIMLIGGVNAVATAFALVPAALFLLTRAGGPRRRRLLAWWAGAVVAATAWWAIPLVVLGRISPPFLDYIEDAGVTTRLTSLVEVVRGTSHWLAFVLGDGGPTWRAGWLLVTVPIVILYTVVVAGTGLVGLSLRTMPERTWLVATALVGLVALTAGYVGEVSGLLAEAQRAFLDGVGAPLRNVHKADLLLRLPLALGIAYALARLAAAARDRSGWGLVTPAVGALVAMATVGSAFPALIAQAAPAGSVASVPGYWDEATRSVADREGGGRALVVPGSSFGTYLWGTPRDEPIQSFGRSPWLLRDAIPLTPPATIRMLDAIQQRFASGRPMPGLADQLAAAGVRYLVIRNDLDTGLGRVALPALVHESLRGTEGLEFIGDFGPIVGGQLDDGAVVDRGLSVGYRAIEVYEVQASVPTARIAPVNAVPRVVGGPDNIVALRVEGILGSQPAVLDADAPANWAGPVIQTDGVPRRELNPGRLDDNVSARLLADEDGVLDRRVRDYRAFDDDVDSAPAAWTGAVRVTASSSAAEASTPGGTRRVARAASALDGSLRTAWWSRAADSAVGEWLEVAWDVSWEHVGVADLIVVLDRATPGPDVTRIAVTIEGAAGPQRIEAVADAEGRIVIPLPEGAISRVRLEALPGAGAAPTVFGVSDIIGPEPVRVTAVAPLPSATPILAVATATPDGRPTCIHAPSQVVCTDLIARDGEEDAYLDRILDVGAGGSTPVSLTAVPLPGAWLDDVIAGYDVSAGHPMRAAASSSAVGDPEGGPRAAIDRDLETAWIAAADDDDPRLVLSWGEERSVSGVRLRQRLGLAASRPLTVRLDFPDGTFRAGTFGTNGEVSWPEPVDADSVTVRFPTVQEVYSVDPSRASATILPVGVSDLLVLGAVDLQPTNLGTGRVDLACGTGPVLGVGDAVVEMAARPLVRDLLQRLPVDWRPCSGTSAYIPGGVQRVQASGGDRWSARTLAIGDAQAVRADASLAESVVIDQWGSVDRRLEVDAADTERVLVVPENASAAWSATLGGEALTPVRMDGWQQGWIVPAGAAGTVELSVPLDRVYRGGLIGGGILALGLLIAAIASVRRERRRGAPDEEPGPTGAARVPRAVALVAAGAALVLAGGAYGLVAAAVVAGATWLGGGDLAARWRPIVAGAGLAAGGLLLALGPWGGAGYAGSGLAADLAVLIAVTAALMPWPRDAARAASPGAPRADS